MTLAEQMWELWKRLEPAWLGYFSEAGLHLRGLTQDEFLKKLDDEIAINFQLKGLEEFSRQGRRGVEPGDPALSLFYHILASPHVMPHGIDVKDYPTLNDLELVENYIYSVTRQSLQDLIEKAEGAPLSIVVFAYEYASMADTVHCCHADLMFSRTGISRVGDAPANYDPKARGFFPSSDGKDVHVVPARFGAFLSMHKAGDQNTFGPLRHVTGDEKRKFWVPLHKLFNGTECIDGMDLDITFQQGHTNQKIRRVHLALWGSGNDSGWPIDSLNQFPFVIENEDIATFDSACGLVVPVPHSPLVEPAKTKDGTFVGFKVPYNFPKLHSSLWFVSDRDARHSPEFVHAKHALVGGRVVYLPDNQLINDIESVVAAGGYVAANFVDWTAEGWVQAVCRTLEKLLVNATLSAFTQQNSRHGRKKPTGTGPALSIVAQPDFFPLVKQEDLMNWWDREAPEEIKRRTWPDEGITASPLSSGRLPGNPSLGGGVFDPKDGTLTAIVGFPRKAGGGFLRKTVEKALESKVVPRRETTLSYKATNLFAPGWDSGKDSSYSSKLGKSILHLANYGLGSPFPEDTLICAASGGFWPGAVPDVTRFFAPDWYPSTTPILDSDVKWDGIPLPVTKNGVTEYKSPASADYVRAVYQKAFQYEKFVGVTFEEYRARTSATARVYEYFKTCKPRERRKIVILSFRNATAQEATMLSQCGRTCDEAGTYRFEVARYEKKKAGKPGIGPVTTVTLGAAELLYASEDWLAYEDPQTSMRWLFMPGLD